jgi:hypothetical protein
MKKLLILLVVFVNVVSCGPSIKPTSSEQSINSTSDFSAFLKENNFYCEEPFRDNSETYSFDDNSFKVVYKNKRSGEIKTYDGTYEVKSGKFSDNGEGFLYVKLIFNNKGFAIIEFGNDGDKFLVYDNNMLCQPTSGGACTNCEDEYGLKILSSSVWATKGSSYEPIDK